MIIYKAIEKDAFGVCSVKYTIHKGPSNIISIVLYGNGATSVQTRGFVTPYDTEGTIVPSAMLPDVKAAIDKVISKLMLW